MDRRTRQAARHLEETWQDRGAGFLELKSYVAGVAAAGRGDPASTGLVDGHPRKDKAEQSSWELRARKLRRDSKHLRAKLDDW
jgi:hypothetical protein